MTLHNRIKQVIINNGLTMERFGSKIAILESEKNNPSAQTICSICKEFDM